jgi:Leucine-rich repeat (LRR) protein
MKLRTVSITLAMAPRLAGLCELCADGNEISSIDSLLALGLPSLATLRMNSNRIEAISSGVSLLSLRELELGTNRIKAMSSLHLERFPNL